MNWLIYYLFFGAIFIYLETMQEDYDAEEFPTWTIVVGLFVAWILWPIGLWRRLGNLL